MNKYKIFYGSGYIDGLQADIKTFNESEINQDNGFSKKDIRKIKNLRIAQCYDLSDINVASIVRIK